MPPGERPTRGFTLPGLLVTMAILAAGLQAAAAVWSHQLQREQEQRLIQVGSRYALALERYRAASPGGLRRYPTALEELLLDRRFVGTVRHLRRLYDDPLQPGRPLALLRNADGEIVGVYSTSARVPIATAATDLRGQALPAARSYAQWVFQARFQP